MIIIHRVFRREFALLPALVRAVAAGDTARADRLAGHLDLVLGVLEHHHAGEDLLLWPKLRERAPEHSALFDEMDGDHVEIHGVIERVQALSAQWRESAAADDRDELAHEIEDLLAPLAFHLDREEAEILPLVDALLTPQEWGELGERALSSLAPQDAMIVLAQMHESSAEDEWSGFVVHLPPPVQEAFVLHALPAYPAYTAAVRGA
ncbi:hypothetical protein GCM10027265_10350 [Jatrophihabitans fulvus]